MTTGDGETAQQSLSLEQKLKRHEELHSLESLRQTSDLAMRIEQAVTKSINEFLIKEHGADENGVPLHYHLGDADNDYRGAYQKADDLIHYIGLSTLNYIFQGIDKEKLDVIKEVLGSDREVVKGILTQHGFDVNKFKQALLSSVGNIYHSEAVVELIHQTALGVANKETKGLIAEIFNPDNYDELHPYIKKKFEKKGFDIKTESLTPDSMGAHLGNLYLGQINGEYLRKHKRVLSKKEEESTS